MDKFYRVTEENDWEGETWYHYFLDDAGVLEALKTVYPKFDDFTGIDQVSLSHEQQVTLANLEPGYMNIHWFGTLDVDKLNKEATKENLYKGGIRNFGESLFEEIVDVTFWYINHDD